MDATDTIIIKSAAHDLYFQFKCNYCGCEFLRSTKSDNVYSGYYIDKPLLWGDEKELVESKLGAITKCPTCSTLIGTEPKPVRYDIHGTN